MLTVFTYIKECQKMRKNNMKPIAAQKGNIGALKQFPAQMCPENANQR